MKQGEISGDFSLQLMIGYRNFERLKAGVTIREERGRSGSTWKKILLFFEQLLNLFLPGLSF